MSPFTLSDVGVYNLEKPSHHPNTGIGFFNHMLDQITSHAQVGISITVTKTENDDDLSDMNRYRDYPDQSDILSLVGSRLGKELSTLLPPTTVNGNDKTTNSRFCCPLDEALVECRLSLPPSRTTSSSSGTLQSFSLAPYGNHPPSTGRTSIGHLRTNAIPSFFSSLAEASGMDIALTKTRGDNGHHVVESAFKAFSRALRNLIDGVDTSSTAEFAGVRSVWYGGAASTTIPPLMNDLRRGDVKRSTKETDIAVKICLKPGGGARVSTGVPLLDDAISVIAEAADVTMDCDCRGDLHIDDHHTSEDVAIAIGQCLDRALGTKAGLNRMWSHVATVGTSTVEVVMDLSNRPCLTQNLTFSESVEVLDGMSIEMVYHFFESIVMNGRMTVHIVQRGGASVEEGSDDEKKQKVKDTIEAAAMAFGRCLKFCMAVDPRRGGATASSKGTLSK
mmetsp:Transcript_11798/g.14708  ORF Transcript_11798/g.14708 Transcript_11798/m.14708 type:complete len:448 (+) Transcript_11798:94-1437(+)|eukprot:CAMPEP_0172504116 /NCGR_PEP_ID=MMETSP1066-20121228/175595_1 /TAXON_ID=671091 /ORGANISM="Coscinodiscus wailesii, Strain CCMP2513" /LENGTH=447 /DNA_ID=CAMNT_0013280137 /DNA_START=67 /DNA_END=1410 /DNA_ORIENTATION=-